MKPSGFERYVAEVRQMVALYRCPKCSRRIGAVLTIVPIEGALRTEAIAARPALACAFCRIFPVVRLELAEWPATEGPNPVKLIEAVVTSLGRAMEEAKSNAQISETN